MHYYSFLSYNKWPDGRIYKSNIIVYASCLQEAEKRVKVPINGNVSLKVIFKSKSPNYESKVLRFLSENVMECIAAPDELRRLDIEVPPNQTKLDGIINPEAQVREVKASHTSKYKTIKCKYCGRDIFNNGVAQFSHMKKHINDLIDRKILSDSDKINGLSIPPKIDKILRRSINEDGDGKQFGKGPS